MLRKSIVFFKEINEAFTKGDTSFIEENSTEDVQWTLAGTQTVSGKSDLIKAMVNMRGKGISNITFTHVITHGNKAAINGTMKKVDTSGKVSSYAFCHIYELNKFKNGKIKEITSYMVEKK